jgi:hypothetical protein
LRKNQGKRAINNWKNMCGTTKKSDRTTWSLLALGHLQVSFLGPCCLSRWKLTLQKFQVNLTPYRSLKVKNT